jgi:hypothetical protein
LGHAVQHVFCFVELFGLLLGGLRWPLIAAGDEAKQAAEENAFHVAELPLWRDIKKGPPVRAALS